MAVSLLDFGLLGHGLIVFNSKIRTYAYRTQTASLDNWERYLDRITNMLNRKMRHRIIAALFPWRWALGGASVENKCGTHVSVAMERTVRTCAVVLCAQSIC